MATKERNAAWYHAHNCFKNTLNKCTCVRRRTITVQTSPELGLQATHTKAALTLYSSEGEWAGCMSLLQQEPVQTEQKLARHWLVRCTASFSSADQTWLPQSGRETITGRDLPRICDTPYVRCTSSNTNERSLFLTLQELITVLRAKKINVWKKYKSKAMRSASNNREPFIFYPVMNKGRKPIC